MSQERIGGTFAPPLSDKLLKDYKAAIDVLPATDPLKDALGKLHGCCTQWWALPESAGTLTKAHPSGRGVIVPLEEKHQKALWDSIPWEHELDGIQKLCDGIDPVGHRDLRNLAFHLLWHVRELNLDREPLTADKLAAANN